MKAVVVYDSRFGNTGRLARAIAETLGAGEPAAIVAASAASERDLVGTDLLAVGGPTQGHGLSPALKAFLERIPPDRRQWLGNHRSGRASTRRPCVVDEAARWSMGQEGEALRPHLLCCLALL